MLLGRERELEAMSTLLEQARGGSSGVLALVGEAGIGKSSLLRWAAARTEGMRVLRARGVESEAHIPFAGLHELLQPALVELARVPKPQADALASALALRPARSHDRFAVGAATLSLLAAYAEEAPLAVLVDDAQWLDGSSADALRFALRRLVADPIAALLSVREDEPSLLDGSDLPTLRVIGLDLEPATELLRGEAPATTDETAARLHRETGGNPLALLELADWQPPELPLETPAAVVTSVSGAYVRRVQALPERTRALLVLAAACDDRDLATVARAARPLGLAASDLAPAEAAGLLAAEDGSIVFRHPLIRSAIYGSAAPEERRRAHRALADALPDAAADRRAWHLALAASGPDERAAFALEQAAGRAHERSAYGVASRAYERASALAPDARDRARLEFAAAESAWLAGLADRARELLDRAGSGADPRLAGEVEHLRGHVALRRGPVAEGRAILLAAAERAAGHDPEAAVVMLAEAAEGAFFSGDAASMRAAGDRAHALAGRTASDRAAFFAAMAAGMGRVVTGAPDGARLIREAVSVLESSTAAGDDARLLAWSAMAPLWLREAGVGDELVDRALAAARARSAAGALPHLLAHIGIEQAATDRYVEARATFDEAIRLARETGQRTILAFALARLAWLDARCGRERVAREAVEEALALARDVGAPLVEVWALSALTELELTHGEAGNALTRALELQDTLDRNRIRDADLSPAPELVELSLRLGKPDDARAAVTPFLRAAAAKRQPWALARAARCRALLAPDDEAPRHFERALALHARTRDVFERARTELAYGARLRRAGKRVRSRERLRAALDAFEELGAAPWAELARVELAASGETARRRDPSTLDDLTPQELRVSLLLAEGKTTREAAAALFLSPKTIEYHLRNAYRKLGVRSREELAGLLARSDGSASAPLSGNGP